MQYFKIEDKRNFIENADQPYDSSNVGAIWFLDTRTKLQHLITLLEKRINVALVNNYNEKPNGMAGQGRGFKLKSYVLSGFIEKKYFKKIDKKCFLKIQFYEKNGELFFSTDVDVNFSDSKNKFTIDRKSLQDSSSHSWKVDDNFPKDWDNLVDLILPQIKNNLLVLGNYITTQLIPIMDGKAEEMKSFILSDKISLNQILYGPPGTGKTYNSINKAISIINPEFDLKQARNFINDEYERLVAENQILFTTFHQSMSYEDFIEGIKPSTKNEKVTYAVEDGVFKRFVKRALIEYIKEIHDKDDVTEFDTLYENFVESIKCFEGKREGIFITKTGVELMLVEATDTSVLVKYLWSNNKKNEEGVHTFIVTKEKLKKVLLEGIEPDKVKSLKKELHPLIGHIHCELFAVYKRFYDFILEDKGEIETIHFDSDELSYEEVKEQFDLLTKADIKSKKVKPYVIIIDEINRGNVSQIFGELITLIEEDKRLGEGEALEVMLPYSKKIFGVPSNLYIVGTMNTADRSVEALDTALRRRFTFEEIESNPNIIASEGLLKENNGIIDTIDLPRVLETINNRIEVLCSRDHKIGHSFFLKVSSLEELKLTFSKNIIPLLKEYFYNDNEKIGWVLGEGFFVPKKALKKSVFTKFFNEQFPDFEVTYQLEDIDKIDIKKAMQQLLGDYSEAAKLDIEN